MVTPLYKNLKKSGTSVYVFPGAAEDISAAYQNENYKMYFSKYTLLDLPKQNISTEPNKFDFENTFETSVNSTPPNNYSEQLVESLRNYVANHETVLRESRLGNSQYYYDINALETTTEKIFWKWLKKLNVLSLEPAIPEDEYFPNLTQFRSRDELDDEYFPEYLWKEREVFSWNIKNFQSNNNQLQIEFFGTTNLRVNDIINVYNVSEPLLEVQFNGIDTDDGVNFKIVDVIDASGNDGQKIILDATWTNSNTLIEESGNAEIVYKKVVKYIGEVNGISNVQEANRSYTEVYANIPDHTGKTPDVLFRTKVDVNYKPNMTFPILPSQFQPEIFGAENFNSPIVNNQQNYPGSYFGQFDNADFTYRTETGDDLRRSGNYYGVSGDVNNPVITPDTLDGLTLDFDTSHYVKMNIPGRILTNFEQFNALEVNNEPPEDFEYNAILWYYTVENEAGEQRTNLYGITILDNPMNNPNQDEVGLRIPTYKKLVSNGEQDGTSFQFHLNLNFNIINENPVEAFNPEAINSQFSMNLFNDAMKSLASTNDSFLNILAEQDEIREEITSIKGLVYTQGDLNIITQKIKNLEELLRRYSTLQLSDSESIRVNEIVGTPPFLTLENISTIYDNVQLYRTTQLYTENGISPTSILIPDNRSFFIEITNDDELDIDVPGEENLQLTLNNDLSLNQSLDISIKADSIASQNKKLDIRIITDAPGDPTDSSLISNIDLPIFYNDALAQENKNSIWNKFNFDIDFNENINIIDFGDKLEISLSGNSNIISNSLDEGETFVLSDFYIESGQSFLDFSGQYKIDSISANQLTLDVSDNEIIKSYGATSSIVELHNTTSSLLINQPYFKLNKGKHIKIVRVSDSSNILKRYNITISDL